MKKLLEKNWCVLGIDGMTNYYDPYLKERRNKELKDNSSYIFKNVNLENSSSVSNIFEEFDPKIVIHLAAQAGVRYSIDNPLSYVSSNLIGTFSVLEALRKINCAHFLMASTSSVYGGNTKKPFKEIDHTDSQMSFYAATKKSNESMSHSYAHLYNIPTTCFRFFTVYGPWGRPDMALFKFTEKIINNEAIDIFNFGKMKRDFTYIDDLTEAVYRLITVVPEKHFGKNIILNDSKSPVAPWRVVNIGNAKPIQLQTFLNVLEEKIGIKVIKNYLPLQAGDVLETSADITLLQTLTGFRPNISLENGVEKFITWYKHYYKIN